jgi:transcriptional regulator with XRE-family HTH domain
MINTIDLEVMVMSYQSTLAKMIENSGLTLKEISERCKQEGKDIVPSYISKLQTGKQSAPSEEVTKAIAEACGENPQELLFEGNLAKTPEMIRQFVLNVIHFHREKEKATMRSVVPQEDEELFEGLINEIDNFTIFLSIKNDYKTDDSTMDITQDNENTFETLGHYESNKIGSFKVLMPDDSLSPIIQRGWEFELEKIEQIENGDFVGVILNDDTLVFRKYIEIDKKILLIAENKKFEPIVLADQHYKIIGKIKRLIIDL